jgi:CheY-like chemotaxis protein
MTVPGSLKPPVAGACILLVDDEEMVRKMIKSILGMRGYKVVEAEDGVDALEKFRDATQKIDLVLMDYHLPRLNGIDSLLQLREMDPKLPAVILSGGLHEGIGEGTPGGLDGVEFLHKPFQNDELFGLLARLLQARDGKS